MSSLVEEAAAATAAEAVLAAFGLAALALTTFALEAALPAGADEISQLGLILNAGARLVLLLLLQEAPLGCIVCFCKVGWVLSFGMGFGIDLTMEAVEVVLSKSSWDSEGQLSLSPTPLNMTLLPP